MDPRIIVVQMLRCIQPCFEETSAEIVKQIQLDMSRQHDDLGKTYSRAPICG